VKMGKILFNSKTLKASVTALRDGTHVIIQQLSSPETLSENQIILNLQRWFPEKQALAESHEVIVHREGNIGGLKLDVADKFNIPREHVCVAKPYNYQLKNQEQLASLNWYVEDNCVLSGSPWYLVDGDLLVVKDDREKEVITEGEIVKPSGTGRSTSYEPTLVINTIYDENPGKENEEPVQETTSSDNNEGEKNNEKQKES